MIKGGNVFFSKTALTLQYKITAMDAYENSMYTGDEKGIIYKYQITPDAQQILQESSVSKQISKSRIDQIKCLSYAGGNLLVLSDPQLFYVDVNSGLKAEPILKEKIKYFVVNEQSSKHELEIIAITNKKEGILLTYNISQNKFEQAFDKFLLPDIPVTAAFIGHLFYLGMNKKSYQFINLQDKKLQPNTLQMEIGVYPYIKATDKDELLVVTVNNFGIFMGLDGSIKQKSTINLLNKQFTSITIFKSQYLVAIFENSIQVFNLSDAKLLSEITINPQQMAKCITSSSKLLFYATNTEIIYLQNTPSEVQIKELLNKAKVDEALTVFHQNTLSNDPTQPIKLEQLKLDCAWSLVRVLQFKQSEVYLLQTNFDLRDFISLYPDFIASIAKMQAIPNNDKKDKNQTISLVINSFLQDQTKEKIEGPRKLQDYLQTSKEFLITILENRRSLLTAPSYAYSMKDKMHLLTSTLSFNQNQWQAISVEDMLELIDFALIKALIETSQFNRLKIFLTNNIIYCLPMYQELQIQLISNKNLVEQNPGIIPRFYESFLKVDQALDQWKKIGESLVSSVWPEACDETVRILKQNPDKIRIFKYIDWVLKKNLTIGCKLFAHIDDQMITPDLMLKHFEEMDSEEEQKRKMKEKYLEVLVDNKKIEEERYHTQLAISYIDAIFKIIPRTTSFKDLNLSDQTLQEYYNKLKNYLKNPNAKYNSSSILEKKVKESWMIPEIIALYGREKRHDEALNKLIELGEFNWAQNYCCDYQDNLLTKLFKKYIDLYKISLSKDSQDYSKKLIKETINNFLKKYATHSQLNPLEVLENIPENWKLQDQGIEDGLFSFLNSVISHTMHERRSNIAAKHLSEMDQLNVECQFAQSKNAHIRITAEKKCAVCNRSIGDKVFVVYPNAVVAHHTCIKNNSICPLTDKDFEKYFKF